MPPAIDDARLRQLSTTAVLMREYPHALSALERETVDLAASLYRRHGAAAPVSLGDWAVIDGAAYQLIGIDRAMQGLGCPPVSVEPLRRPVLTLIQGGRA